MIVETRAILQNAIVPRSPFSTTAIYPTVFIPAGGEVSRQMAENLDDDLSDVLRRLHSIEQVIRIHRQTNICNRRV